VIYKASAPEMISISSLVITACLVRLNVNVSLVIISSVKYNSNSCYNCTNSTDKLGFMLMSQEKQSK